jgi:flagellar basal-body rod protein FlgG
MILQLTRPVQAGIRQERQFELISNHLANANSTGFKKDILSFDKALEATLTTDHAQGGIRVTDNPLDLALQGEGFFKIETAQGMRYTRDGNFTLTDDGQLVTQIGDAVQGENGAIILQGNAIRINEDGQIEVDGEIVDTLQLVHFADLTQLEKDGQNQFVHKGDGETEEMLAGNVAVQQGALELSNISVVHEMTHMIEMHRLFETYQKVIHSFDEMDTKVITEVGRSPA